MKSLLSDVIITAISAVFYPFKLHQFVHFIMQQIDTDTSYLSITYSGTTLPARNENHEEPQEELSYCIIVLPFTIFILKFV